MHVIFTYKGKNHLIKKDIRCKDDVYTHLYTLIVNPDNTYEVRIDDKKVESGSLEEDWDLLPPKKIKDPEAKKPSQEEWDEREKIADPTDTKPEDWEKPEHIPDADATKPEDWDDEMDGEWEPAMIDNPEYKGEWKPKQMDNPDYKGKWVHPEIDNPEYTPDDKIYAYEDFGVIGFDLWQVRMSFSSIHFWMNAWMNWMIVDYTSCSNSHLQNLVNGMRTLRMLWCVVSLDFVRFIHCFQQVKAGTIFDDVLITDDEEDVKAMAAAWKTQSEGEKKMKDAQDEEQRKKDEEERKKMEEEEKAKADAGEDAGEDDEDAEDDSAEDMDLPEDADLPEEVNY